MILSQDCDLDWDFKNRQASANTASEHKLLTSVLLTDLIGSAELRGRAGINSRIWDRIRDNKDERYQFLRAVEGSEDLAREGIPEGVIDFKQFFTLRPEDLYLQLERSARRRTCLVSPYAEHLSVRFFNFHERVALPAEHWQTPPQLS